MNALAISLHGLLATVWIGGMFFMLVVLRPSIATLEPHRRLTLFTALFKRFFPWVWMAILVLPLTGYWLVFSVFNGFATSPVYVHVMHVVGLIMIALFVYLYFRPLVIFKREVKNEAWQEAGKSLNRIRQLVQANLFLGLVLLVVVYAGRYGLFG